MAGRAAQTVGSTASTASRAELEALCAVVAAAVDMAEAVRSEAATVLLRRALSLIRGHSAAASEGDRAFRAP